MRNVIAHSISLDIQDGEFLNFAKYKNAGKIIRYSENEVEEADRKMNKINKVLRVNIEKSSIFGSINNNE